MLLLFDVRLLPPDKSANGAGFMPRSICSKPPPLLPLLLRFAVVNVPSGARVDAATICGLASVAVAVTVVTGDAGVFDDINPAGPL